MHWSFECFFLKDYHALVHSPFSTWLILSLYSLFPLSETVNENDFKGLNKTGISFNEYGLGLNYRLYLTFLGGEAMAFE